MERDTMKIGLVGPHIVIVVESRVRRGRWVRLVLVLWFTNLLEKYVDAVIIYVYLLVWIQ